MSALDESGPEPSLLAARVDVYPGSPTDLRLVNPLLSLCHYYHYWLRNTFETSLFAGTSTRDVSTRRMGLGNSLAATAAVA